MHLISFTGHISMAQQPVCLGQNIFVLEKLLDNLLQGPSTQSLQLDCPSSNPGSYTAIYAEARLLLILCLSFPNCKIMITVRIEIQ